MKTPLEKSDGSLPSSVVSPPVYAPPTLELPSAWWTRLQDYVELAKFRLSLLVLVVTATGFCLGSRGPINLGLLIHCIVGTGLVAFAANALNQLFERDFDSLMRRTADRPLPSGRMSPGEALAFGVISAALGLLQLAVFVNIPAMLLAAATILLYLFVYTPLKRVTPLNTLVGAIPGAIPPVIGFAAARGQFDVTAWLLFAILFVWQLPHFFAIAWMYREDYASGGYRMLSVVDPSGVSTGRQTVFFSCVLLLVSLLPTFYQTAGYAYFAGAIILGFGLIVAARQLAKQRSFSAARTMLLASIVYLPLLMALMLIDRVGI